MSATTLVAPEREEAIEERKDPGQWLPRNGNGNSQSSLPDSSVSILEKLDEAELKAAITSAWKMHERGVTKDMAPLLFWLRLKLRAQGTRNDIRDKDRGFGAWVDDNLDITRRTADRWADKYALDNGLIDRKPTSGQVSTSGGKPSAGGEVGKHGKAIQFTYWVTQTVHKEYEQALKTIKKQFKIANDKEAVLKGVCYAAETIAARSGKRKRG